MKTLPKIALGSVAALLVLVIGLLLYVLFGDLSVHKDRLLNAASDATGFYYATFDAGSTWGMGGVCGGGSHCRNGKWALKGDRWMALFVVIQRKEGVALGR